MIGKHASGVARRGYRASSTRALVGAMLMVVVGGVATVTPVAGAATAKPKATIKIGTYAPIADNETGAAYPQIPAAVKAAVRAINKSGGFNGAKGEVVACDTKENPNDAAACGRKFVDEGVVAVVGGFTLQGGSLIPILQDASIPNIGMVASNAEDALSPISYPLDGALLSFPAQALQLGETGPKSLYIARADISDAALVPKFIEQAASTSGVEVTDVGSSPLGAPDLVPAASAAEASGAKAVSLIFPDTDAVKFILAADQIGYHPTFTYTEGGFNPDEMKQLGNLSKGMIVPGPYPPLTAIKQFPELKQYLKDMRAQYKTGDDGADPTYHGSGTIRPWLAVQALRAVIETDPGTTVPTAASVLAALNAAKDIELGLIPPWTPSASPIPIPFPRVSNPYVYMQKIRNGKTVLVSPEPINIADEVDFVAALKR